MATFKAKKLELTQVNGGQEYEQGDFLQSDTINDVVEGTAYAQNVAEAANTTSNNAVSTANSANKTANAASTKVDGFDERITAAKNKADTAYDNAATAQSTADNATTEINKIKNGTTVVPNANHANNADNANLATKAQQDVNGNPINTTYATVEYVDDLVTEKQGTRVTVNNANVAELSFTSDPQTQINDIVDGSQTVGKAKQDANGNVIDTTYAKLSQVVRTDAAQSLTDEQKQQAQRNLAITVTKETTSGNQVGWWRVAQIKPTNVYNIKLKQAYKINFPAEVNVVASVGYMNDANAVLSLVGGYLPNRFAPSKIRVCGNTTACYIDIYTADAAWNTTVVEIKGAADSSISQTEFSFIGTSDTVDGYNVVVLDFVSGTNTSGGVYQKGAPVFATDPSKLAPSTANGWTETTATGSLPSAGVYMVAPNASIGTFGIGVMFYTADGISVSAVGSVGGGVSLVYISSSDTKWAIYSENGQPIQLDSVHYKRIA